MVNPSRSSNVTSHGKFLSRDGKKLFFKAMRFEAPGEPGDFSRKLKIHARLEEFKDGRTTALIVKGPEAETIMDLAAQQGLLAMLEIDIDPAALLDRQGRRSLGAMVSRTATMFRGHPALAGYLLNLRVEADWLRLNGLEKVRRWMRALVESARKHDGAALVALNHRPETRALWLTDEDLLYSSVPPMTPYELKNYIVSLHNLADCRPVIIELSESTPEQDELVACAFAVGAAGVVAHPIRLAPRAGLLQVRALTASELLPFMTLNGTCPPALPESPMVSVVICAYNAERTMRPCLESLRELDYPNYEVVIVDDGSRDRTAEISMDFPEFRLIRQPNKGLSVARNVGAQAARGEIIAYTDSDCVVDSHWLTLLVGAMVANRFDACGGPNYAPAEEGRIEACVAVSPGAPCQVLTAEDRAEHLAGCNMVFRKPVLTALGGFDAQFTSAGDDVDICWRALDAGFTLGFCPAAFVWHFRRNTVKAYYGQQRGYGRAEAMLYFKYPERFNSLGQVMWKGRIPGLARTIPGGATNEVLWSAGPRAFFQTIYEPRHGLLKFLPQTLEWQVAAIVLAAGLFSAGWTIVPALLMLAMGPIWALYYGWQASIEKRHDRTSSRLLVAMLSYTGPMVRAMTRYRLRMRGAWSAAGGGVQPAPRQRPTIQWLQRAVKLAYWSENWTPREALLDRLTKLLSRAGHPVIVDQGWNDYDLEVRPDAWTRIEIKTADEEHGGDKLKNHVVARVRLTWLTTMPLLMGFTAAAGLAAMGHHALGIALGELTLVGVAFAMSEAVESLRLAYRATEEAAIELDLVPLGKLTRAGRRLAVVPAQAPQPVAKRVEARAQSIVAENPPPVD